MIFIFMVSRIYWKQVIRHYSLSDKVRNIFHFIVHIVPFVVEGWAVLRLDTFYFTFPFRSKELKAIEFFSSFNVLLLKTLHSSISGHIFWLHWTCDMWHRWSFMWLWGPSSFIIRSFFYHKSTNERTSVYIPFNRIQICKKKTFHNNYSARLSRITLSASPLAISEFTKKNVRLGLVKAKSELLSWLLVTVNRYTFQGRTH